MLVITLEDLSKYETLFEYVSSRGYDKYDGILICRNMCRAVAELHKMGIVHGDLSSGNFMIHRGTKDVKLIDFDLSKMKGL